MLHKHLFVTGNFWSKIKIKSENEKKWEKEKESVTIIQLIVIVDEYFMFVCTIIRINKRNIILLIDKSLLSILSVTSFQVFKITPFYLMYNFYMQHTVTTNDSTYIYNTLKLPIRLAFYNPQKITFSRNQIRELG